MSRRRDFPLSEGVRGITSLAIIVVHVWLVTETYGTDLISRMVIRLDACVAIFFALSAFLLYRPMIARRTGGPHGPSTREYARRRFFRIYPTYWFTLTVLAVVPGLAGVFGPGWWAYYSLAANWIPEYSSATCYGTQLCGLPQTWTLTTEMSFYILLPAFAWATTRLWRRRPEGGWVPVELALIAAAGTLSLLLHVMPGFPSDSLWFLFSFVGHFDWLGLGLALAVISVALEGREPPALVRAVAAHPGRCYLGALAIYAVMVVALPPVPFPLEPDDLAYVSMHLGHLAMATLILLPVVFGDPNRGASRRFLGHPVAIWFGLISYGLYLWHFTIAYQLGTGGAEASFGEVLPLTLLISIPLAAFSWYAIERPMMRFKYRRPRRGGDEEGDRRPDWPAAR